MYMYNSLILIYFSDCIQTWPWNSCGHRRPNKRHTKSKFQNKGLMLLLNLESQKYFFYMFAITITTIFI